MSTEIQMYHHFTVSSGALCYGILQNIWHGASSPIHGFPQPVERRSGGTVISQILEFNVAAENGLWKVFKLVNEGTDHAAAWFACHADVEPEAEVDKILRVSGSPYEFDSGSRFNDENTNAEGVLVINRYDWNYYDKRAEAEVMECIVPDAEYEQYASVGVVDYDRAKEEVQRWQSKASSRRDSPSTGAWMHLTNAEYTFGRFVFNDARTSAKSFLFFATTTDFTHTTFVGRDTTLRLSETEKERFHRYLREGRNFEGVDTLERMLGWFPLASESRPPEASKLLGPYDSHEYLLQSTDIDTIGAKYRRSLRDRVLQNKGTDIDDPMPEGPTRDSAEKWKEMSCALLNEMILSYLEFFIVQAVSHRTVAAAAAVLFPDHDRSVLWDSYMYRHMTEPDLDPNPEFDTDVVEGRIRRVLRLRCANDSLAEDDKFVAGVRACLIYLLSEVLELAINCSVDNGRTMSLPVDIRVAVLNVEVMTKCFRHSRIFWKGYEEVGK